MRGATVLESATRPCLRSWSHVNRQPRANRAALRHSAGNARLCRGLQNRGTLDLGSLNRFAVSPPINDCTLTLPNSS